LKTEELKMKPTLANRGVAALGRARLGEDDREGRQVYVRDNLRRAGELALQSLTRRQLNEPPARPRRDTSRGAGTGVVIELAQVVARHWPDRRPSARVSMHVPQPNPGTPPAPPPEMPPTPDVTPPEIQDPPPTPHQQPPIIDPMPEPGPPNPVHMRI
jgi:hypothetical protein